MHRSKVLLFNQLIGSREKRGRHGETERLGGLKVEIASSSFVTWRTGRSLASRGFLTENSSSALQHRRKLAGALILYSKRLR